MQMVDICRHLRVCRRSCHLGKYTVPSSSSGVGADPADKHPLEIQQDRQVGTIVRTHLAEQTTTTDLPDHLWSSTVSLETSRESKIGADRCSLWQIVLTIIAIKYKNTMQVVAVSLFNYAFLAYAVMMVSPVHLTSLVLIEHLKLTLRSCTNYERSWAT